MLKGKYAMARLDDVVRSLAGPMAGAAAEPDKARMLVGLDEYAESQRVRGWILAVLLLLLLATPLVLSFTAVSKELLPYLFGGTSVLAAGTVKMLLTTFQDISRAHTLTIVCQSLNSKDARDVLTAWLKGRT